MNSLLRLLAPAIAAACFCLSARAAEGLSDTHTPLPHTGVADLKEETDSAAAPLVELRADNYDVWKYKRRFMVGFTSGTLDQKKRFGGEISSRWGASIISGRNIYLHRKAIGGFLKFGLNLDLNVNYANFAKGTGKLSDITNPGDINIDYGDGDTETEVSLGRHYITAGIAVGPTATFAPFYASGSRSLAALKFRPYFHVVPSYAAYIISDDEDTEIHSAFALWCAAGMEIQWKRLIVGLEWKGCTAKYKGMVDDMVSDFEEGYEAEKPHKFDMNMLNVSIGFAF
ncbi:MAG: hypothetical protein K2F86_02295 [Duncaniella sp.]|nr:hypothetical protein [Duncaniella sp.]